MAPKNVSSTGDSTSSASRSRLMSIVASVGLVAFVGSCCICGGALYQQWPRFESDPEAATAVTQDILSVTVPAVFAPEGTIDWNLWMFLRMRGAYYTLNTGDGELSFLEVDSRFVENDAFREHLIESLREHGAGGGFDLKVKSSETKTYDVAGEPIEFHFLEAEDRTTGNDRRLVDGIITSVQPPVMVSLWVDEENWDPQMVDEMIASIKSR